MAILLRHSTIWLVKRYTKMNVAYLHGTLEEISTIGQPQTISIDEDQKRDEKKRQFQNGTVTETVNDERAVEERNA